MPTTATSVRTAIEVCLVQFLRDSGKEIPTITDATDLIRDITCQSDEGLDFVLDLCELFEVDLPHDFNPFVHENGRRGRKFGELVRSICKHVPLVEEV